MTSLFAIAAAVVITSAISTAAMAACSLDDAMAKSGTVSDALLAKVADKPDAVSKLMMEMGELLDGGRVTEQTCVRLDALAARAARI